MVKKILISGFSHCGTTILRSIIGHIENVYEIIEERDYISENDILVCENFILYTSFASEYLPSSS